MTDDFVPSDVALLDVLRKRDSLSVSALAECLTVTPTAVRQRLNRLMAQGYVDRTAIKAPRGRPSHRYELTAKGRRKSGSNHADLAIALWQEVRQIRDPEVRRGLLQRIAWRLAVLYGDRIIGKTIEDKMQSIVELFGEKQIPLTVEASGHLPILTALVCPYPDIAEQDRGICAMERMLFSELLGEDMRLSRCRLDGENCCTFEVAE